MRVKEESEIACLKQHTQEDHGIQSHHFIANKWGKHGNSTDFIFLSPKCLWMVTAAAASAKLLQSCPTLCDPKDGSPPGSTVHRIFQARVLEWAAIAFSGSSSGKHENTYRDLRNFVPLFMIIKNSGTETGDSPFS